MKSPVLPRLAQARLQWTLKHFPVVALTGARQTGKSTLVRHFPEAAHRTYLTLDDLEIRRLAEEKPDDLLQRAERLTLDEIQRHPDLILAIKRAVDQERRPGQFLLTGSADLLLMQRVSESLAGRAIYLHLRPFTESEKAGRPDPGPWSRLLSSPDAAAARAVFSSPPAHGWRWTRAVLEGGFPTPALEPDAAARRDWLAGYTQTYLERDLRQLARIEALLDFQQLMKIAALRVGRWINQADLARDASLSPATTHRYLNLLETSFLIARVRPYAVSRTKRMIKMPKLFWGDTGLAAFLAGALGEHDLLGHESAGGLLENLVWHHLQCWADLEEVRPEVMTWRTASGEEVDFVVEARRRLLPIEVKAARSLRGKDLDPLRSFLEEYRDRAPFGVALYTGSECYPAGDRILAVPLGAALASN